MSSIRPCPPSAGTALCAVIKSAKPFYQEPILSAVVVLLVVLLVLLVLVVAVVVLLIVLLILLVLIVLLILHKNIPPFVTLRTGISMNRGDEDYTKKCTKNFKKVIDKPVMD